MTKTKWRVIALFVLLFAATISPSTTWQSSPRGIREPPPTARLATGNVQATMPWQGRDAPPQIKSLTEKITHPQSPKWKRLGMWHAVKACGIRGKT